MLTVSAFRTPGRYYSLERINAKNVTDIEDYLQGGTQYVMHIKVRMLVTLRIIYKEAHRMSCTSR